jgi:hypothetical protein
MRLRGKVRFAVHFFFFFWPDAGHAPSAAIEQRRAATRSAAAARKAPAPRATPSAGKARPSQGLSKKPEGFKIGKAVSAWASVQMPADSKKRRRWSHDEGDRGGSSSSVKLAV